MAASVHRLADVAITVSLPQLLAQLGPSVPYVPYAVFAAVSFVFVLVRVPETKGVQLEDMESLRSPRQSARQQDEAAAPA